MCHILSAPVSIQILTVLTISFLGHDDTPADTSLHSDQSRVLLTITEFCITIGSI